MTPTDLAGLCERLKATNPVKSRISLAQKPINPDGLEAAAAIESLVAENERMREALKGLVERLLLIHDDPQYIAVWTIFQTHCGPYRGPQYVRELEAARTALEGASDDR
jgi:hypothetical protein